jgi:glycerophosphoryl diester phosphodiesterase
LLSRDGVLFARHDLGLAHSTDIATHREFATRAREIAGVRDWWIGDFDAAELDTLRAIQTIAQRGSQYDGHFVLPRFSMLLDLRQSLAAEHSRPILVDAELKHSEYFRAQGLDMAAALAVELESHGLTGPQAPVWVECFDHAVLRKAHARLGNPCFALLEVAAADAGKRDTLLRDLAIWTQGVAPSKFILWDNLGNDTGFVSAAHTQGLQVHAWTFRDDQSPAPFATPQEELNAAFALGVDALFCDFPDTAVAARAAFAA